MTTASPPLHVVPIMASLVLALVPVQLDGLVAATAMPTIAGSLGGFDRIGWIATSYLLTMAVGTALGGRIGDMFGRRSVLVAAQLVFLAGSTWAALSGDMTEMIVARAVQGFGAGMTFTTLMATVADIAPPDRRARYQGVFGAVAPFSMIIGPWAGGLVTDHLGWRWIFWLNLPVVAIALLGALFLLRLPRSHSGGRVDVPGLLAIGTASTGLVLAASWGGQYGWASAHVLVAAFVGAAGIVAVRLVERRAEHPFLPLDLFADRAVVLSFVIMFLGTGAVMMAAMNYLPVFLQIVQGQSSSSSGLLLLPMLLPAILVAVLTGRWTTTARRFRAALVTGTGLLALGCSALALMGTATPTWVSGALMVLAGSGIGLLFQTPLVLVQNSAPRSEVGAATGAASYLRTIGGALGVGALGSAFTAAFSRALVGSPAGARGITVADLGPHHLDGLSGAVRESVVGAAAAANSTLFWVAAGLAVGALVAALAVPRRRFGGAGAGPAEPEDLQLVA